MIQPNRYFRLWATSVLISAQVSAVPAQESPGERAVVIEPVRTPASQGKSLAILIGVQDYQNLPKLKYAKADVALLAKTLKDVCKFDRVVTMTEDAPELMYRPTLGNLSARIRELLTMANGGEYQRVLLYFSGHGFRDGQGHLYFAPPDCDPQNLLTGLQQSYVKQMLDACDSVRIKFLVLDCCHAGEGRGSGVGTSGSEMAAAFKNAKGLLTMASCGDDQLSLEWDDKQQGLFTYWLCEGLKGAANENTDAAVDHGELRKYVYNRVLEQAVAMGRTQEVVFRESDDWRGVAVLSETFSQPQPVMQPDSVTAVFTLREENADGPLTPGVEVELWYRADANQRGKLIVGGVSDANGRLSLEVPLSPAQWLRGDFLALVKRGDQTKTWQLTDFPRSRSWSLFVPAEEGPKKEITNTVGIKLVLIPAGQFKMGSSKSPEEIVRLGEDYVRYCQDEHPQHPVRITAPFYLGATEVTVSQFRQFIEATKYETEAEKDGLGAAVWTGTSYKYDPEKNWKNPGFTQTDEHPVTCVSWNDVMAFIRWLNEKEGVKYDMPTEAQWEYACRAGSTTMFPFGDDPEELAEYGNVADATAKREFTNWSTIKAEDGYVYTSPVGKFQPNAWKLHDMTGNLWEWCRDWYGEEYYDTSPGENPDGAADGTLRVVRGGSWSSIARDCRSAYRNWFTPEDRSLNLGFRVARSPSGK